MADRYSEDSNLELKLTLATMDLVDIIAEKNRRAGHGSTKRADVVRDAVGLLFEKTLRKPRIRGMAVTEAQEAR